MISTCKFALNQSIRLSIVIFAHFFLQELSKLVLKSKREARNEKDLYQKMLGHAQKLEQKSKSAPATQNRETSKVKKSSS